MRKLASIQAVESVEPIPGADSIERCKVLGWWVVCRKGEHKTGDKVVYCEIDSLLPERQEFEFLRARSYKPAQPDAGLPAGFRIKTAKLRGQVSQGICFPLSVLPDGATNEVGADVTEILGVKKWEAPVPAGMSGKVKGAFPGFLTKTDEVRVQVLEKVLERHRFKRFMVTEKLDGASFTAFRHKGVFGICSRNLLLDENDETSVLVRLAKSLNLEEILRDGMDMDLAIQGEVIGPGIQGNKYGLGKVELRVFNVIELEAGLLLPNFLQISTLSRFDLKPVPQLGEIVLNHSVDELVAFAEAPSILNPKIQREGVVLRPPVDEYDEDIGGRLSFKVINPKFLLKYDE